MERVQGDASGGAARGWRCWYLPASAWFATPDRITDKGAGMLCYTAPITLVNHEMIPVYQFYPTIIIGQDTRHIVTAYPGDRC